MIEVEKLKQKILDLAIRGKLVPQDPNDEPASVLIEKIKKEKEQLVKEGKIKASKNDSYIYKGSDNCYYEKIGDEVKCIDDEIPFEIPESWEWVRLGTIFKHNTGKALNSSKKEGQLLTYITTSNVYWDKLILNDLKSMYFTENELEKYTVKKGDLLVCEGGDIGRAAIWNLDENIRIQNHIHRLRPYINIVPQFYYYVFWNYKIKNRIGGVGIGLMGLSSNVLHNLLLPLPPINEQNRIIDILNKSFRSINTILQEYIELEELIAASKHKILDDIFGENSSYKSYYKKEYEVGTVLEYEQPGPYIVKSTNYSDEYNVPVLTPGKSFILGYTNETNGIYKVKNKVIIFDDFTTDSRLIDFDFKVKSSAMKILSIKNTDYYDIDYMYYLLQTLKIDHETHKRYWISEYKPFLTKIHDYETQLKIVQTINRSFKILDSLI